MVFRQATNPPERQRHQVVRLLRPPNSAERVISRRDRSGSARWPGGHRLTNVAGGKIGWALRRLCGPVHIQNARDFLLADYKHRWLESVRESRLQGCKKSVLLDLCWGFGHAGGKLRCSGALGADPSRCCMAAVAPHGAASMWCCGGTHLEPLRRLSGSGARWVLPLMAMP